MTFLRQFFNMEIWVTGQEVSRKKLSFHKRSIFWWFWSLPCHFEYKRAHYFDDIHDISQATIAKKSIARFWSQKTSNLLNETFFLGASRPVTHFSMLKNCLRNVMDRIKIMCPLVLNVKIRFFKFLLKRNSQISTKSYI